MTARSVPSALLRGRYEPLSLLGSGGEARVMKALDHQHGRLVALKIRTIRTAHARDELLREARVLLQLPPHTALPLVREDFFEGDTYVVVMDWVDGTDLARILRDRGNPGLAPSSVLAYLAEAAAALTYLHAHDVCHGDLKPGNLILTRGGHVQLVDFGMSSSLGMPGRRLGTAGYRAPELASGAPSSRAADVYALAATAFALLTGAPPAGVLPDWTGFNPVQAKQFERALREGLATGPEQRPATPGEFVERLRAGWVDGLPTGVATFCLSDIVGSTALWDRAPRAMAEALVRHDELIAAAAEANGGRLLKSMGEGDSTVTVFEDPSAAIAAAVAATRSLVAEPWPDGLAIAARFGVHTGEAEARGGDYFGPTVNRAARLRAQAEAGEILLSETTTRVVADHLPDGCSLVDLGWYRLRGVSAPERVFALAGPGVAAPLPATDCPYRGLLSFEASDRGFYFGREDLVADLLQRLWPDRLAAVVGASGSGKSSLLRAGLIAAVDAGEVVGVRRAELVTPGTAPALALRSEPSTLLVVDQFEELFTVCEDVAARERFMDAVLAHAGPVAIGVRADFYGALTGHAALAREVADNQVLLGAMSHDALRRAITEPARLAGLRFEPGLVDIIVRDVAGEPGALPLLSHALRATWERRDGRTLTVEAYRASGGVSSAVAQTADAVAAGIPEASHDLLRGLFLRLTELGEGSDDTRRRVAIDDLVPQGTPGDEVRELLERLAEARLVTLDHGTAEVAHEVLIREWPTLRRWLDEDRASVRLQRALGGAAQQWASGGRMEGDLYRGARLTAAAEWAREHPALLNATERAFLDASLSAADSERRAQLRSSRRLRRSLAAIATLLLAALALLAFALVSRHQTAEQRTVARSKGLAAEAQNQLTADPELSLLLARRATRIRPTHEALFALRAALDASMVRRTLPAQPCPGLGEDGAPHLAFVAGGRIAETHCDRPIVVVDPATGRVERRLPVVASTSPDGAALPLAADPAQPRLAVGTQHGVRIVDVHSGEVVDRLGAGAVDTVAYSPAGNLLAVHRTGKPLTIWDLRRHTRRTLGRTPADGYERVLFTRAANALVIVAAGNLRVYDRRTGALKRGIAGATMAAMSPDGRALAVATRPDDGLVAVYSGKRFRTHFVLARFPLVDASALAFSPDGSRLAIGLHDGASGIWSLPARSQTASFDGNHSRVTSMAFSANGRQVVSSVVDGTTRLWAADAGVTTRAASRAGEPSMLSLAHGRVTAAYYSGTIDTWNSSGRRLDHVRLFPRTGTDRPLLFPALSPDGSLVAFARSNRGPLEVRRVSGGRVARLAAHTGPGAAAFTPDGLRIAYFLRGRARIATIAHRGQVRLAQVSRGASCGGFVGPAFSADGRRLAATTFCGLVGIWDARNGRLVRTFKSPDVIFSLIAFSPDGRRLAWGSTDTTISIASVATGRRVAVLHGHTKSVTAVAFTRDGRRLVSAGLDNTVRVWDLRSSAALRVIPGPDFAALAADGRSLIATDHGGTATVRPVCPACEQTGRLLALAARRTTRDFTDQERRSLLAGF